MVAPVRSSESVHLVDLITEQSQNCMETNHLQPKHNALTICTGKQFLQWRLLQ